MIVNTDWSNIDKMNLDACVIFRSPSTFSITPSGSWEGVLYYSNDGATWQRVVKDREIQSGTITNDVYSIYMKGINNTVITGSSSAGWLETATDDINVYGNIETLLDYRTVLSGQHPTMNDYAFYKMFSNWSDLVSSPSLPARSLSNYCYAFMFDSCTSLTTAPALPALTLANHCYRSMFRSCSSLIATPALPATTLAEYCYHYMFRGCTSLTTVPASLPVTTLKKYCYTGMFRLCRSLTTAPSLPATSLKNADACYADMFNGCSSLTTAPALPATTLEDYCYNYMFANCDSLTTAPALPATMLEWFCYDSMFSRCTSLTTAPALPATMLATGCYSAMFEYCTSLTTASSLSSVTSFFYEHSCSNMFAGCTSLTTIPAIPTNRYKSNNAFRGMFWLCKNVKVSATQDSTYSNFMVTADESAGNDAFKDMFHGTTGPFTGTPVPGVTYYTSNPVV